MWMLEFAVPMALLVAACSCNGQKRVSGPDSECDKAAISAEFDEVYGAIDRALDELEVIDCETAGRAASEWLDRYGDRLQRVHELDSQCKVEMKDETWQRYARVIAVLDPPECAEDTVAGVAYARYKKLVKAIDAPVSP
jgi:hypothetical protein